MVTSPLTPEKIHPLFQALCRFYSDKSARHVHFWGLDVEEDYTILIDNMIADGVLEMT